MSLIKSFVNKKEELGYEKAIPASLKFLLSVAMRRISALPYYVSGLIDYHFNPNALKQSEIEPFIDNEKIKCKSFAVDLHLPPDKNDPRLIECDATNMPFDDESISKIALHCAYEMFENDADINLVNEANRVLKSSGKMVIMPLYMAHLHHIQSRHKTNRRGIEYGKAKRVWREDKNTRFVRIYSVDAFKERVANCEDKLNLKLKIFYFTNEQEMKENPEDQVYVKFAACFAKE